MDVNNSNSFYRTNGAGLFVFFFFVLFVIAKIIIRNTKASQTLLSWLENFLKFIK
jgi:hypothetical protein